MKQPTLLERLLMLFSKKRFKQYIDRQAYLRYKDSIDKINERTNDLEKETKSMIQQINDKDFSGIVYPDFNELKLSIPKLANLNYKYNEIPPREVEVANFSVQELEMTQKIRRAENNIRYINQLKRDMSQYIAKTLISMNFLTFEKELVDYSMNGEEEYEITAKLKIFK